MVALLTSLIALLSSDSLLQSIAGPTYSVRVAEVWNLPGNLIYPLLALNLERQRDPLHGAPRPQASTAYSLRCYYATEGTMAEAYLMRDSIKNLLHLQQSALIARGVFANWIELIDSRITMLPALNKHQAYLEFDVIA